MKENLMADTEHSNDPIDMPDVRAELSLSIRGKRLLQHCPAFVTDADGRNAEGNLAQFYTVSTLYPVATFLEERMLGCDCGMNVKKDCDHVVFRCPRKDAARRELLAGLQSSVRKVYNR